MVKQSNSKQTTEEVDEKPRPKPTARKQAPSIATGVPPEMPMPIISTREIKEKPRTKQTARKQAPSIAAGYPPGFPFEVEEDGWQMSRTNQVSPKKESVKKESVKKESVKREPVKKESVKKEVVKKEPAIKKEPVKKETKIKKEPAVKKETSVKKKAAIKKEELPLQGFSPAPGPSNSQFPSLGLINGIYDITCPYITEEWDSENLQLILAVDGNSAWGAYDFGMFEGIIHFPLRPFSASEEPLICHWRGRDNGEGEMSFGDNNVGSVQFLGGGKIHGTLNLMGDCEFWGSRRPGPAYTPRSVASYVQEWDSYNENAYEEERVGRW